MRSTHFDASCGRRLTRIRDVSRNTTARRIDRGFVMTHAERVPAPPPSKKPERFRTDEIVQTRVARVWRRSEGVVQIATSNSSAQTLDDAKANIAAAARLARGERVPVVIDMTIAASQDADCRAYYGSEEAARQVSAIAIVTPSAFSRVTGNFLLAMNSAALPMKMFGDVLAAVEWLAQDRAREA